MRQISLSKLDYQSSLLVLADRCLFEINNKCGPTGLPYLPSLLGTLLITAKLALSSNLPCGRPRYVGT